MGYILALDAGTSKIRSLIVNELGYISAIEQQALSAQFPHPDWMEHDPEEIWKSQVSVVKKVMSSAMVGAGEIEAIGITNQRETTIVWDKKTSKPIYNAIAWNDRRTTDFCTKMKKEESLIRNKTGLYLEPYFSASKIAWILDNVEGARIRAERGELAFGTVDTWLLWNLTGGKVFATDVSNASRTLLFNIHTMKWDEELLELFNIPSSLLPEVKESNAKFGETVKNLFQRPIPITAMIGDQQSALFGHGCFQVGDVKCTFGTCTNMMMNIGSKPSKSKHKLLTTVAWKEKGEPTTYALEGVVYSAGSVIRWLQESLGLIHTAKEIEGLAYSVSNSGGVYFVPALSGLATPYWNANARGTILGISPATNVGHIARATLEGIAYQVTDALTAMQKDAKSLIEKIKCDGGMTEDLFFMKLQADLINIPLTRAQNKEVTALGAAFLAGLAIGYWKNKEEIQKLWQSDRLFLPEMDRKEAESMKERWHKAIKSTELWAA
jgi:glycerol kinase